MGNTFARLFPFTRRGSRGGSSHADHEANGREVLAADDLLGADDEPLAAVRAELEAAPVLRPAAIFRQLLYDPAEVAPVWARPRPAPAPEPATPPVPAVGEIADPAVALTDPPKPAKRTRRPKADPASAAPARPRSKRAARKDQGAADR